MFPIRPVVVAVIAACGSLLLSTALVMASDKIKVENPRGFHTSMSSEFFRPFWESLKDQHKMKGKVSDHLTREQIDTIFVLAVNIAIADGPKYPSLQDELLAFMTEGNRFETGRLPDGFEKVSSPKYVVALFRTKKGDYGLITRYAAFAVIELNGYVGIAPVAAGDKTKRAVPAKKEGKRKSASEYRYGVYWLSEQGGDSEYRMLLVTRVPLGQLPEWVALANLRPVGGLRASNLV